MSLTKLRDAYAPGGTLAIKLGEGMREAREATGISQQELADICQLSRSSILRFENGQMIPIEPVKVMIAAVLNRPVAEVFPTPTEQEQHLYQAA